MAKKEFTYRGKTLEELRAMSTNDVIKLMPTRSRRSIKRGMTPVQKNILEELKKKDSLRTHNREMVILPSMVGKTINIHNGKAFTKVFIEAEMIGHVLGEFSLTRNRVAHSAPGIGATKSSANISVK
jgi:small subunit ribosomal protein S19